MELKGLTIAKARALLDKKEITSLELTRAYLAEIEKHDGEIHAYLEVFADALEQAEEADKRIEKGESLPLLGIPLAVKDNILIHGRKVSTASKILENYVASYDATVIEKLRLEGAVFIGRTNCDEFAMGGSTENSAFGVTRNPVDPERVPGGSSGGSAAAVAMQGALAALGSDTGGSIRQPSAFCGAVGLKPTYGSVSRHGLMAMGSSLDVIGPITTSVEDAALLYRAIRGRDPLDSTSRAIPDEVPQKTKMTIGVPRSFLAKGLDKDVEEAFEASLEELKQAGHTVVDIDMSVLRYTLPIYYIIMPAEASTNLARFDGVRYGLHVDGENRIDDYKKSRGEGFGPEVRRRILLGTYVLSAGYYDAYYGKAVEARKVITQAFKKQFETIDAIATPTSPTPAFTLGEKTSDPLSMYLADIFTVPANIAGVPALSVPAGTVERDGKALPVGTQFMAPHFHEETLFVLGKVLTGEK